MVVNNVAQHERGTQKQHQICQGQVQDINTETAGSTRLLIAASAHQVTMTPQSKCPNHQPIERYAHLKEPDKSDF